MSRGPDPPELPSGVHAKRKIPVRIFFLEGGGVGGYTAADDELTRTPPEPSNLPTPLLQLWITYATAVHYSVKVM